MLLLIHIAAGGLALVLGFVALFVKKGGTIRRRSGLLFVCAMLVMGISASILGFLKSPTDPNVTAGFTIAYFVGTALTTVRPVSRWTRGINVAALTVAVVFAHGSFVKGDVLLAVAGPRPPHVASARPTRFDAAHHSHEVTVSRTALLHC